MQSYEDEWGYIQLVKDVLNYGVDTPDRTGVGCRKLFDINFQWNEDPTSTIRPVGLKTAWREMRFFLQGETDSKKLEEQGVMFWQGNTSREFLDNRGLHHLPEGSMGSSYSKQWRDAGGMDQLLQLLDGLTHNPYSRRHAIDLWGVSEQDEMPLLPCWYRWAFYVEPIYINAGETRMMLHLKTMSRSCDLVFGKQFHALQARQFQLALANLVGMQVGGLSHHILDAHIYHNQEEYAREMVGRKGGVCGQLLLMQDVNSLDELIHLPTSAFQWSYYEPNRAPFKTPRPPMAV